MNGCRRRTNDIRRIKYPRQDSNISQIPRENEGSAGEVAQNQAQSAHGIDADLAPIYAEWVKLSADAKARFLAIVGGTV
jgi:hypothetical protein